MTLMGNTTARLFIFLAASAIVLQSACSAFACDPLQGGIKLYSGSKGEEPQESQPAAPVFNQPPTQPSNTMERQITITESNSVFSIGLPAGYREERSVTAQKPIDFWFEYLTPEMALEVNGQAVEIPVRRYAGKLGYSGGVYNFSYVLRNLSGQPLSYNLRMVPTKSGDAVPAVTREKWIAP